MSRKSLAARGLLLCLAAGLPPTAAHGDEFGAALRFTRPEQRVLVPGFAKATTDALTLELRVRLDEPSAGEASLVGDRVTPADYVSVLTLIAGSGEVRGRIRTSAGFFSVDAGVSLVPGRWNHLAYVIGSGRHSLYVNGRRTAEAAYVGELIPSSNPLYIGRDGAAGAARVSLDDVRVWATERSALAIDQELYRPLLEDPDRLGLIGYWPLDEGAGTSTASPSNIQLPGTLEGAPDWVETAPCSGDLDGKGQVDGAELARFADLYGLGLCEAGSQTCPGDLNIDGSVDELDLARLAATFGRSDCRSRYLDTIVNTVVADLPGTELIQRGYTGLPSGSCVQPYIPGRVGTPQSARNVNVGIGGTPTGIWVRYASVPVSWAGDVLAEMEVQLWPNWDSTVACTGDWVPASGTSDGIQGALTILTSGGCGQHGLCVRNAPLDPAEPFIANTGLSETGSSEPACPVLCESNGSLWPMQADTFDIHRGCGDSLWMYVCTNEARDVPPTPRRIELDPTQRLPQLEAYAPRVWLPTGEPYMPASVDWSFTPFETGPLTGQPKVVRFLHPDGRYWIRSFETLASPSDVVSYFLGPPEISFAHPDPLPVQDVVPVYGFWVDKAIDPNGIDTNVIDLVYFFFYPYNRGKSVIDTIFGSHVGDWEHVTVRLVHRYDDLAGWTVRPHQLYVSAHDFGTAFDWDDPVMQKVGEHPVVYSAQGSHGLWIDPGAHLYNQICIPLLGCADLIDHTSEGTPWDTWLNLVGFDFAARQGIGPAVWPLWMGEDFSDPGLCGDPADPTCGPIYRWGNVQQGGVFGFFRLENGPTGPVSKGAMRSSQIQ